MRCKTFKNLCLTAHLGTSKSLTPVEDFPASEVEDLAGVVPLLQGRRQLRGRDVQVDGHQRDADQTHMNPPLSHLELSGGGVAFLPLRDESHAAAQDN